MQNIPRDYIFLYTIYFHFYNDLISYIDIFKYVKVCIIEYNEDDDHIDYVIKLFKDLTIALKDAFQRWEGDNNLKELILISPIIKIKEEICRWNLHLP